MIKGAFHNFAPGDEGQPLGRGHPVPAGKVVHDNHCEDGSPCLAFIYTPNGFDFKPATEPKPTAEAKPAAKK